jgi:hypothetical protein
MGTAMEGAMDVAMGMLLLAGWIAFRATNWLVGVMVDDRSRRQMRADSGRKTMARLQELAYRRQRRAELVAAFSKWSGVIWKR